MNWLSALASTFDQCSALVGKITGDGSPVLLPISHSTQNAQIEITLNENAEMVNAAVLPKEQQVTVIPVTENSGGRSGKKPVAHPLFDKLQYLAGDFLKYGGVVTSGYSKNPEEPHESYMGSLKGWLNFAHVEKLQVVYNYLQKGQLIEDLAKKGVIPLHLDENGEQAFQNEWTDQDVPAPLIFTAFPSKTSPQDAFIRWAVNIPGDTTPRLWEDNQIRKSWEDYYRSIMKTTGLCYISGTEELLATSHPKKIRHAADGAKLISANDASGFTYRGRFTDKSGSQANGISYDLTQKAHNTLRWLIARQGWRGRFGSQAMVAWAVNGQDIPDPLASTSELYEEEEFLLSGLKLDGNEDYQIADTAQAIGLALKKKINGYRATLGDTTDIVVLAMDSATPGRMALTYYRELTSGEFLERLEKWHAEMAWYQDFGKDIKFIGAPSPRDIAHAAYGTRLDDNLKASTHRRLLPCIIENRPIPNDLVSSCVYRAENRIGMEPWEWEKLLGIACALYRKQQNHHTSNKQYYYTMSLDTQRSTRSYLYGRLLAVADVLEKSALTKEEQRPTNAARLMKRFAARPYDTWQTLFLSLEPYQRRLLAKMPEYLAKYEKALEQINGLFKPEDFQNDSHLDGEFLLSFYCQRKELYTPKNKQTNDQQD